MRGLQLDLLVSGDRARADRAIDIAVRLLDRSIRPGSAADHR
ncbi:hypothetical protein [Streptomyces sp. x-80]